MSDGVPTVTTTHPSTAAKSISEPTHLVTDNTSDKSEGLKAEPSDKQAENIIEQPVPEYENELDWLLRVDVKTTIEQLNQILSECATTICNTTPKAYNLLYCSQNQLDTVKINANIDGYKITSADINIKLASKHPMQTIKTCIKETSNNPFCWRLYQIQDANNHLNCAMDLLSTSPICSDPNYQHESPLESAEEVLQLMYGVMNSLQKSRSSLLIPKKSSVEELQHCQNMQSISPALPLDYSISFYVHSSNMICSVYQLAQNNNRAQVKNEYRAEVPIPYLSDVLILLSLGLQMCQQLKDKIHTLQNIV